MEIYQLRYYICLAEELNFRRAASKLFISQSALSQQIDALEKELGGIKLLYRDNKKVMLLPAGEMFYERAKKIVEEADSLIEDMSEFQKKSAGTGGIVIGYESEMSSQTDLSIINSIFSFGRKHPDLDIRLEYIPYNKIIEAIEKDEIDLGILQLNEYDFNNYKYCKTNLLTERLGFAVSAKLDGSTQEIFEKYPLLQLKDDERFEAIIRKLAKQVNKNCQIKYVDSVMNSLGYVTMRKAIIPGGTRELAGFDGLRVLDLPEDAATENVITSAVWKKNDEIIKLLTDELKIE